ncbi:MAG: right-handed parallel beta-helix repeat-containing protein [Betaproteobacteria bacterium]|nr:right-handed parallel beta-helix repeat-containing protein [Betaproteobacteria bacterium]
MLRVSLAVAALLLSFSAAFSAYAAQRTFVSTTGNDANTASNCSTTAPCRGFTAALTVTDSGGEIIVLSSGGYGPVTINKSVSIIAPEGVYAGISVFSGNGITISTAGVDVVLRGLTINRLGGSGDGIKVTAGHSLMVQNCVVTHFNSDSGSGVYVTGATQVRLLDSLLQGNFNGAHFANGPSVLVSNSRFIENAFYGLVAHATGAGATTKVEVSRSEASGNGSVGYWAGSGSSGRVEFSLKDSVTNENYYGVFVDSLTGVALASVTGSLISGNSSTGLAASNSGVKLVASGNTVTRNGVGLSQAFSAVLESAGDNLVRDNTTNSAGTITTISKI